jgi:N12 class adenine-specific DNA methylase
VCFEEQDKYHDEVHDLAVALSGEVGYEALRRSVLNAHYTYPAIAEAMWEHLADLGLESGEVLEPGCGAGNFLAYAPPDVAMVGVEMEPVAAAIARALHPGATIHAKRFEDTELPFGHYAASIGNVPFANVRVSDRRYGSASIHNYFLLRAVEHLAPGGVAALLTSRYSLDSISPSVREALYERADLLAAIRLPVDTHKGYAGTQVVMDLLVLRRRKDGEERLDDTWLRSETLYQAEQSYRENAYFSAHPEHRLGVVELRQGPHESGEPVVVSDLGPDEVASAMRSVLADVAERAKATGRSLAPAPFSEITAVPERDIHLPHGSLAMKSDGSFYRVGSGEAHSCPKTQAAELRALIEMRDLALQVLDAQGEGRPAHHVQAELRGAYAKYAHHYGAINRASLTERPGEDGELEIIRRAPPMGGFRSDPLSGVVFALELYDDTEGAIGLSGLATRDVLAPPPPAVVETIEDGLVWSLGEFGRIDAEAIGAKIGISPAEVREGLLAGELAFIEPASGELAESSEYLAGHVAMKLAAAREAASADPSYERNVAALESVMPVPLGIADIAIHPGAPYVATDIVRKFLIAEAGLPYYMAERLRVRRIEGIGVRIEGVPSGWMSPSKYRIGGQSMASLFQAIANNTYVTVTHKIGDTTVVDQEATLLARQRQDELLQRFEDWVRSDEDATKSVVDAYDAAFGGRVLRTYDGRGLVLPGLALDFEPHDYQRGAATRMASERSVLLGHQVGAGKTAIIAMGLETLRRFEKVHRPMVVVPNHLLDQFHAEYARLYPRTRILAAAPSWSNERDRVEFTARVASGDYDVVVTTMSAFGRIPLKDEVVKDVMRAEVMSLRRALVDMDGEYGASKTIKRIERAVATYESRLDRLSDMDKDVGPTFESLGVDYLVVDEAHLFKNLERVCSDRTLAIPGSKRAFDLYAKMRWLSGRKDGPYACFATGTPVANSIAEVHTMLRFLAPEALESREMSSFDAWLAAFGRRHSEVELSPEGGRFRVQTRFSRFVNVPELVTMFREVMEIPPPDAAPGIIPDLETDKPIPVVVPSGPGLKRYIQVLGERADAIRSKAVEPTEDNMLKVVTDGRKAALDLRLVGEPSEAPKLEAAAENIARIYRETKDLAYEDARTGVTGEAHEPGAFQIVFLDLDTPGGKSFSAYEDLRDRLVARGIPVEKVRFVHEAGSHEAKRKLFDQCRTGKVSVLIGSSERMGLGTNVQDRAIALHHLDCPWRPAEVIQREGRIMRQGNQNEKVAIYRYASEGSFDVYMWQTVERKARFIHQVMHPRDLTEREVEDVDQAVLSYGEIKALAAGNPLILERVATETEVRKLEMMSTQWRRQHQQGRFQLDATSAYAERWGAQHEALRAVEAKIGEDFIFQTSRGKGDSAAAAGELLRAELRAINPASREWHEVGNLSGIPIVAQRRLMTGLGGQNMAFAFTFAGCPIDMHLTDSLDSTGLGVRLHNMQKNIATEREAAAVKEAEFRAKAEALGNSLEDADPYAEQTIAARRRLAEIDRQMEEAAAASATYDATAASSVTSEPEDSAEFAQTGKAVLAEHLPVEVLDRMIVQAATTLDVDVAWDAVPEALQDAIRSAVEESLDGLSPYERKVGFVYRYYNMREERLARLTQTTEDEVEEALGRFGEALATAVPVVACLVQSRSTNPELREAAIKAARELPRPLLEVSAARAAELAEENGVEPAASALAAAASSSAGPTVAGFSR